ncbi:Cytochrome P450 [Sinosporangium album]|uniref:Cytochrome P450 n=1 Tax=Sinosporangium album TaxID=504805 RepID=A0A1G8CKA0_9ACTN|nr:cytochrome P450 [Sinosporangium album]SDH45967.1 Cytochrome P450 [Sinosporangium album]
MNSSLPVCEADVPATGRCREGNTYDIAPAALPEPAPDPVPAHAATRLLTRLRTSTGRQNPYPVYAALRNLGPLLPTTWGGLLATDYDTCARVLREPGWLVPSTLWKDRNVPGWRSRVSLAEAARSMMQLDGSAHARQRTALAGRLSARAVAELGGVIERAVGERLDALDDELRRTGCADYVRIVSDPLPMTVLCLVLGLPTADAGYLVEAARNYSYAFELSPTAEELDAADTAAVAIYDYVRDEAERRRAVPRGDLLSDLVEMEDREGPVDLSYLVGGTLVVTGWETTAALLNGMVVGLGRHPEQAAWLRANPGELERACREVLRWDPPAQLASRVAEHDTVLAGRPVAAGQIVHALLGSAQHDPANVARPEQLDFSRDPAPSLAFGLGPHYCAGSRLALLEGGLVLSALLERFSRLTVVGQPERPRGIAFRDITSLMVAYA